MRLSHNAYIYGSSHCHCLILPKSDLLSNSISVQPCPVSLCVTENGNAHVYGTLASAAITLLALEHTLLHLYFLRGENSMHFIQLQPITAIQSVLFHLVPFTVGRKGSMDGEVYRKHLHITSNGN